VGIIGGVGFIVALLISVMIHEFGHYATARRYGMKVTEFFIGFGPRIWSIRRGETEFGIKAIPAGGYCRISGMSAQEELSGADEPRAFFRAPVRNRLVVLGAGSFLHFVLGILLFFILFTSIGTLQILPTVTGVRECISTTATCGVGSIPAPAKVAGIKIGDKVIGINGVEMPRQELDPILRASAKKEITLIIDRGGEKINISLTPATRVIGGVSSGVIGIESAQGFIRESFLEAIPLTGKEFKNTFIGSLKGLWSLPSKIPALMRQTFFGEERTLDGPVGLVGVTRVSAQVGGSDSLIPYAKLFIFLQIIAGLNIFVGIFNLLPILPMDGGHMAVAVVEGVRRRIARARGKPDPGAIDVERLTPITLFVFLILVGLTLLLLAADIFNPISLNL